MPRLVLGPMLRFADAEQATIWLETDSRCEATVESEGRRWSSRTFAIEDHHYALIELDGLEPAHHHAYSVALDGEQVWPQADSPFPRPLIVTPAKEQANATVVFGSCRVSLPHHPPFVLDQADHRMGHGVDALRAYALRAAGEDADALPSCLLLLGDQIYADQLSPQMLRAISERERPPDAPEAEVADFAEYAMAYREAWCAPEIRWLLSTVPTAMIFDDHEIHAQWKISQSWLDEMRPKPWYDRHIAGGLMAYWVYQHLGNLSPAELAENPLYAGVRERDDAGEFLRREMANADRQAGHSRWSHCRDIGRNRLIVIDTRAGREFANGGRKMIDDAEWDWVVEKATGDFEHLMIASSVPFYMTKGLHFLEAFIEALGDGAWGDRLGKAGEKLRRACVSDHWPSFQSSFEQLENLIAELATGARSSPPSSLVLLSGDVHHCYLAEVGLPPGNEGHAPIWQAVCSAQRKQLAPKEKLSMRIGNSRLGEYLARGLARAAQAQKPRLPWRIVEPPTYVNQIATLSLAAGTSTVSVETTADADWRAATLGPVFSRRLSRAAREAPAHRRPESRQPVASRRYS